MLAIKYKSKELKYLDKNGIKATIISYELEKEDMDLIAQLQTDEYKIQRFFLYREWGSFELAVDNIENGKILQGGLIDNKYILNCYDVESGLNELLLILSLNEGI